MALESAGVEPVFKVTATGKVVVGITGKIHFDGNNNDSKLQVDNTNTLTLIVEASISINGGLLGFLFAGGDVKGAVTKTTYAASAETGLKADLALGAEAGKGPFLDARVEFLGLIAVGKKVTEGKDGIKKTKEAFRYEIIEQTSLMRDKYYFEITP